VILKAPGMGWGGVEEAVFQILHPLPSPPPRQRETETEKEKETEAGLALSWGQKLKGPWLGLICQALRPLGQFHL
jgi:hypothetical protein